MFVVFNGGTVFMIALASLAAGAILGSVLTVKATRFYRRTIA